MNLTQYLNKRNYREGFLLKHKSIVLITLFIFAFFVVSKLTVYASFVNLIVDDEDALVESIDDRIKSAFDSGEQEIEFVVTGPFVSGFRATENGFAPEESYFTSTNAIHKYRYTAGNDYKGLAMDQVHTEVSYSYNQHSTEITSFNVKYSISSWNETPAETEYVNNYVKNKLPDVLGESQTEYDKVKAIHDYIILNFDYSYSDTYNAKSHSAYGMITNGRGVSSAYSLLFDAFCRAAGLETRIVFSDESYVITENSFFNHSWNMVVVNGRWYHVDVTWDDQPHLKNGIVYNYFLKSSDYFLKNYHLWDDRPADGSCGTPYPSSTKNYYDAPDRYDGDSISRPIQGDMPRVVERVIGLQSSIPEVIELSSSAKETESSIESSNEEIIEDNGNVIDFIGHYKYILIIASFVIIAIICIVIIVAKKGNKRTNITINDENKVSIPDKKNNNTDYDEYDGFDI